MRNSRINPKLSSWALFNGNHDFNKVPLAPPGTKKIIHNKPNKCTSWQYHGTEGWYIGPAHDHYRCLTCYLPLTRTEIVSDTVRFLPTNIPIPEANIDDYIRASIQELIHLLTNRQSKLPGTKSTIAKTALVRLSTILGNTEPLDPSIEKTLVPTQCRASEGEKNKKTVPIPPMSDEEFNKLLESIPTKESNKKSSTSASLHLQNKLYTLNRINRKNRLPHSTKIYHSNKNAGDDKLNHIFNTDGHKESIDSLLKGENSKTWSNSLANELGRLAQGLDQIEGNDCLDFIHKNEVPKNKKVTYANMVCDFRPLKQEKYRVRLTVGGDRLDYEHDATSPAASLIETKLLLNSVISDSAKGARFMTLDIKDFFLQTCMQEHEFMKIHSKYSNTQLVNK